MFTMFFRAMFLYAAMILTIRALGKHQMGEFQPYELAFTILLADIISGPIGSVSTPMLYGLLPVAAVVVLHGIITVLCMKSDRCRAFFSGKPTAVISRGVIDHRALNRLCISPAELAEGLRGAGFLDMDEVGTAVVEVSGTISAFPAAEGRPVCMRDMGLPTEYEGLPLMLIMDGRAQPDSLAAAGRDKKWLEAILKNRGIAVKDVYVAALNTRGRLTVRQKDDTVISFAAMRPDEVNW